MKNLLIGSLVLLAIWSCSNSQKKSSVQQSDDVNQPLKKITNADFKTFVETFAIGKFPFDVSKTPLFADGEIPVDFHEMSLENVKKFSPDATENKGYYTGYAIFEENYVALIYFYSYSSLFGGLNYHTSVNLLTFSFDGKLIGQILLGEANTTVNSNAKRESQKMEGSVYPDKASNIKISNYLEEEENGSGNSLTFLIKPDGEIERRDTVSEENKAGENPLEQYKESLPPSEGYIPVRNNDGKWGYVYEDGKVLIECQYKGVSSFDNGKAVVKISGDEDWQKNYHYIDTNGNDLGSFFEKKSGNDTIRFEIVLSTSAEEYFQRVILGNYPGGVMYCGNFGSSGGYKIEETYTFYPEVSFEKIIAAYASLKSDYSAMIKKFEDNPFEFTKGDIEYTESGTKFLTRVQKDDNGKISLVRFFKTDPDDFGEKLFFEVKDNGVIVEKSTQLPQR